MKKLIRYLRGLVENRILINPPRRILLTYWILLLVSEFILLSISVGIILFITIPLMAIWLWFCSYFFNVWKAFRYSKAVALIPMVLGGLSAIILGPGIRAFLLQLIISIIG